MAALKVVEQTRRWFLVKTLIRIDDHNASMLSRIEAEAGRLANRKARTETADTRVTFGILSEGFRQIKLPHLARELRMELTDFNDEDELFEPAIAFRRRNWACSPHGTGGAASFG